MDRRTDDDRKEERKEQINSLKTVSCDFALMATDLFLLVTQLY